MLRRDLIKFIAGSTAAWPLVARAQQRFRIGLLHTGAVNVFSPPFIGKLHELGYLDGKNITIEQKFAEGSPERLKEYAGSGSPIAADSPNTKMRKVPGALYTGKRMGPGLRAMLFGKNR